MNFVNFLQRTRTSWRRRRTRRYWKGGGWGWYVGRKLIPTTLRTSGSVTASTFTWWPGWWREPASTTTAASSSAVYSAVTLGGIDVNQPTDLDHLRQLMPSLMSPVSRLTYYIYLVTIRRRVYGVEEREPPPPNILPLSYQATRPFNNLHAEPLTVAYFTHFCVLGG